MLRRKSHISTSDCSTFVDTPNCANISQHHSLYSTTSSVSGSRGAYSIWLVSFYFLISLSAPSHKNTSRLLGRLPVRRSSSWTLYFEFIVSELSKDFCNDCLPSLPTLLIAYEYLWMFWTIRSPSIDHKEPSALSPSYRSTISKCADNTHTALDEPYYTASMASCCQYLLRLIVRLWEPCVIGKFSRI